MYVDNTKKNILVIVEGQTQGLDHSIIKAEVKYSITLQNQEKVLYGSNSFLFVNATKIYQFKARDSEIKPYSLCLVNISKDFTINRMNKAILKGVVKVFSVYYNAIYTNDILDIHRDFIKEA